MADSRPAAVPDLRCTPVSRGGLAAKEQAGKAGAEWPPALDLPRVRSSMISLTLGFSAVLFLGFLAGGGGA